MGILKTFNGTHQFILHVKRQAGGNAVRVNFVGSKAFRLDENLVAVFARKAVDFVLDGWTIARPDPLDHAGEHRRPIQPAANNVVGFRAGMCNPTGHLARMLARFTHKRKHRHRVIARLLGHHAVIQSFAVDTRRCAGFKSALRQFEFTQAMSQGQRRRIACSSALVII